MDGVLVPIIHLYIVFICTKSRGKIPGLLSYTKLNENPFIPARPRRHVGQKGFW